MNQNEITAPGPLLDPNGHLSCPGFAYNPLLTYSRARIKASVLRIKEWDYYLINDDRFAVALTIAIWDMRVCSRHRLSISRALVPRLPIRL